MTEELRKWTCLFNISQSALKSLTSVLNKNLNLQLPTDPRTLMRTPKIVNIIEIDNGGGSYWHQGLEFCLRNCFKDLTRDISISININIDGLPLYKSSFTNFWPVLFNIAEYPYIQPMAIGIFCGDSKPHNVQQYLRPFVEEICPLLQNGIEVNGKKIIIRIRCFICDSPARAFIKGKYIILTVYS
jgi:hypothetical protein